MDSSVFQPLRIKPRLAFQHLRRPRDRLAVARDRHLECLRPGTEVGDRQARMQFGGAVA